MWEFDFISRDEMERDHQCCFWKQIKTLSYLVTPAVWKTLNPGLRENVKGSLCREGYGMGGDPEISGGSYQDSFPLSSLTDLLLL